MKHRKSRKMVRFYFGRPSKMLTPSDIELVRSLYEQNQSIKKTAKLSGFSRLTVSRYLSGDYHPKETFLEEHRTQVRQMFLECEGHCVPLQRKIEEDLGKTVHLRTLQRFCKSFRTEIKETVETACRYETEPGQHMQIDFGERNVMIAGESVKVHFFVATLAFSRRIYVKAYYAENQGTWLDGIESSFSFFKGIPVAILSDNTKCLITTHRLRRQIKLTAGYEHFCNYWQVVPIASLPRRPQGKGKVERSVRYVKENALVGKTFNSIDELNNWLERWSMVYADNRVLDMFKSGLKTPKERFLLEVKQLRPFNRPRIACVREETRHVDRNSLVRVDNAYYRVPDSVRNTDVQILVDDRSILVSHRGELIIELDKAKGVYQPKQQPEMDRVKYKPLPVIPNAYGNNKLQRPLEEYAVLLGGNW